MKLIRQSASRVIAASLLVGFGLCTRPAEATNNNLTLSQVPLTIAQQGIDPNIFFLLDDTNAMESEWLGSQIQFGFTPTGGTFTQFNFGYPMGNASIYGTSGNSGVLPDVVPGFGSTNLYGAQFRSSYVNNNYYNPTVTYTPWACASAYPESSGQSVPTQSATVGNPSCHWDSTVGLWVMPNASVDGAFLSPYDDNGPGPSRALNVWNDDATGNPTGTSANNGYIGDTKNTNGLEWWIVNPSGSGYEVWNGPYPATLTSSNTAATYGFWPAVYWNYIGPRPATSADLDSISNYQEVQICPPTLATNSNSNTGSCTSPPSLPNGNGANQPLPYHTYTDNSDNYYYFYYNNGALTYIERSYQSEMQNFANWYSFDRSRANMARAGASIAFMHLPPNFRVDFSTVSKIAGGSSSVPFTSTEPFTYSNNTVGGNRGSFLGSLFSATIDNSSTPLRTALLSTGQWFGGHASSSAPWGSSQAEATANGTNSPLSCRANYTLLASGDYWSGKAPGVGNVDNTAGPLNTYPQGGSTGYTPSNPYMDGVSDTLADVAQQFWETDLQPLVNDVPTNSEDPAFWQHMVTFTVGMGEVPTLVQTYMQSHSGVTEAEAQQAVYLELQAGAVSWPAPGVGLTTDADDLWHAAVDGHGAFLSAQNPTQFAAALENALTRIVSRTLSGSSVATNTQKAGQVRTNTQVYQALYHPINWWGELLAEPILLNPTNNQPYVSPDANWDASCVLTGGPCPAMGVNTQGQATNNITAEAPDNRTILTYSLANGGLPFEWNSLTSNMQALLNGTDGLGSERLAYLRGTSSTGTLRVRTSKLGDIVHSSPVWVGYAKQSYPSTPGQPATWTDRISASDPMPENTGGVQTFQQFETANWTRLNVVYSGSNDGMLHGFESGSYTYNASNATLYYSSTDNDGKEVLAFVPRSVYKNINLYTSVGYGHHYYVDATPAKGDVFYGGTWHTWLVGGLGAGGKELYALDVNNPANFSEANAASLVKADFTTGNLTCANDTSCAQDLGDTFGTPEIRRFHNGQWGIIWGNGYNSANGEAGIFIGLINATSGAITVYWYGTGVGPLQDPLLLNRPDGIDYVNTADLDGDHIVDYAYAGDLFGNVWRLNLTSSDPTQWHFSSFNGSAAPSPLFQAVNANGTAQPITTKVQVVAVPSGLPPGSPQNRLLVLFGTGKLLEPQDGTPNTTVTGVQSIYGVWDWNLKTWNGMGSQQYAYEPTSGSTLPVVNRTDMQQQTITYEQYTIDGAGVQVGLRQTSQTPVSWADLTYSGTAGTQYGWYLDLISGPPASLGMQGEMVVYSPVVQNGVFLVNTTILGQAALTCGVNDNGGWSMALDPNDGAMLTFNAFAINNIADYNNSFSASAMQGTYAGVTVGAVGSPAFLTYDGKTYMVISTSSGQTKLVETGLGVAKYNIRVNWQELR